MNNYTIAQLDDIEPVKCPCGFSRRAFVNDEGRVASMHLLDVKEPGRTHYHKKLTEIYLVIQGESHIELDGDLIPVKPMTAVLIKPGCRHRALGGCRIIVVPIPAFDPNDEWFD